MWTKELEGSEPRIICSALSVKSGKRKNVCDIKMVETNHNITLKPEMRIGLFPFGIVKSIQIMTRIINSTLLSTVKTNLPILNPTSLVTPSALNFNHASKKLMPVINPAQQPKSTEVIFCENFITRHQL